MAGYAAACCLPVAALASPLGRRANPATVGIRSIRLPRCAQPKFKFNVVVRAAAQEVDPEEIEMDALERMAGPSQTLSVLVLVLVLATS